MRRSFLVLAAATVVIAVAVIVLVPAGGDEPATTTVNNIAGPSTTGGPTISTSTTSNSTSTTAVPGPPSPLNGLPVADPDLLDRRVVAVKIDNYPSAPRPQSGLQDADAVFEYLVYGDSTRLLVLFHHSDSECLGPIRSIRPTDSALLARIAPVIFISGGQAYIRSLSWDRGVGILNYERYGYWIINAPGPHEFTKYSTTSGMRQAADDYGYADEFSGWLYEIAEWDDLPEKSATNISLEWSNSYTAGWVYEDGVYKRYANGDPDLWIDQEGLDRWILAEDYGESLNSVAAEIIEEGHGAQLAHDVLVVMLGHQGYAFPPEGVDGSPVPQFYTTGSGDLLIFYQGRVLEGTWERNLMTDEFLLLDNEGNPVTVPPGLPWISLFPDTYSITY